LTNAELTAWNHGRYVRQWYMDHPDAPEWPPDPSGFPLDPTQTEAKARLGDVAWANWVQRGIWDSDYPRDY